MTQPDPIVVAWIDEAVQPWLSVLETDELKWLRQQLAAMLEDEPRARALLHRAHPRSVDVSGERMIGASSFEEPLEPEVGQQ
jgi:hypothetical protein